MTAAAQRAAEAERERQKREAKAAWQRKYRAEHSEELNRKRREKKQREKAEALEELSSAEPFPTDTVIAAAVNQVHHYSVVEAEGHSGNKHVIIENISLDGIPCHRVKQVTYSYHKSFDAAMIAAKSSKIKLQFFGSGDADA